MPMWDLLKTVTRGTPWNPIVCFPDNGGCFPIDLDLPRGESESENRSETRNENAKNESRTRTRSSRNEKACKANKKGIQLFRENNFTLAAEYFKDAYLTCKWDCASKDIYENNLEVANIASEAQWFFDRKEYAAAVAKFQEAYNADVGTREEVIYHCIVKSKNRQNEVASSFYQQGLKSFEESSFTEAMLYFKKAYQSCTNDYASKSKFFKGINIASLVLEANDLRNGSKITSISKLEKAYSLAEGAICRVIDGLLSSAKDAQNQIATEFYYKGLKSFEANHLTEAVQYFEKAYNSSFDLASQNYFSQNKKAVNLTIEAQTLLDKDNYAASESKFQEARYLADSSMKNVIDFHISHTKSNRNQLAHDSYERGLQSFTDGRLKEAVQYFNKAHVSCSSDCTSQSLFLNTKNVTNVVLKAEAEFNNRKFDSAINKFDQAYKLSNDSKVKNLISLYIKKANASKAELVWATGIFEWKEAWVLENTHCAKEADIKFQEANVHFSRAFNIAPITKYHDWLEASNLKVKGNKLFNQGIVFCDQSQPQEALSKLQSAQDRFQKGFDLSQDGNFNECILYIQKYINFIEDKCKEEEEVEKVNTAMKALVCDLPVVKNNYELDRIIHSEISLKHNDWANSLKQIL